MTHPARRIKALAVDFGFQLVYAFGSRAREALACIKGNKRKLSSGASDLDIGIKSARLLTVNEKVRIARSLEEIFGANRIDLVVLSEAPAFLALEIVQGELLYAADETNEAEYQLYIMRRAADLFPFEKARRNFLLEMH